MFSEYKEKLKHFYKIQVLMFRIFGVYGLSPDTTKIKKLAYELYFSVIFFCVITYDICLSIEFIAQPTILDKIVKVFFRLAAFIGATFKLFYIKKNGSFYKEPVSLLNKAIFAPIDSEEKAILDRSIKLSRSIQTFYGGLSVLVLGYILVSQKIAYPQNLPVAAYIPFGVNFLTMEIYSYAAISFLCLVNVGYELWCTSFLIFIKAQLEILGHRLEEIGRNTSNNLAINRDLKNCIRHYADVLKFVSIIEKSMALPVSVQMCCSVSILCSNFYAMSFTPLEEDIVSFIRFFTFQTAMLLQIFLLCYYSNEVTLESLKLSHAIYSSNWVTWDVANRKLMKLAMIQFQNPILVRSINRCYAFDLNTFTSIVNTSYSYFVLLKEMNNAV